MKERNILLSQLLKSSTASDIQGGGHCAADKPGFLSLWTVIPYCSKAAGRGEQTQTLVHWHDARPAFYSQEISLERERGDKMFRRHVTECQTARNSQLMLLAPSRVTMGTQSWPGGSLSTRCGWIIQSWCRASGRQDSLSRGQFAGDTGGNRVQRLQATYTCWLNWWCIISGRPFFLVVQGQSELLIFIQLLVRLKSIVSFHWFFFGAAQVSPSLWKRGHILDLLCTNRSYCSSVLCKRTARVSPLVWQTQRQRSWGHRCVTAGRFYLPVQTRYDTVADGHWVKLKARCVWD